MKSSLFLISIFLSNFYFSQIEVPGSKVKKCYERENQGKKFNEWECGKIAGVVDCNEKLTYDETSKLVVSGNMGSPFTGTCETCHMNGMLERRITFVNGKENGPDTTKYKSGCIQVTRNHIQGVESGQWIFYYDSTSYIAWERNYNLGELHGRQLYLTREGDTTRFEHYINGKLHGVKKSYYPKSKLEKEITYANGLFEGSSKYYNWEGKIIQDLTYKQGKKNGELKYYYDDGTVLTIEHWNMDQKDGEFKTFYYQGNIQTMENYKKGVPEGWFEEKWPDDKFKRRALYKKGVIIEEHRFDEHGTETYTFGGSSSSKEDDAAPDVKKKTKKKKKKGQDVKTDETIKVD